MTTSLDIASQALGLLRANTISAFTEGTNEADICTLYYDNFAKDILTRYPWSFATKKRKLNQHSTAPLNEYRYAHIVPAESMRLWALFPAASVGTNPIKEYDLQTIDGLLVVLSNYPELWADYTVYTDEANWPPYFVTFAFKAFAALIAKPVTDQDDLAARLKQDAWGTVNENEQGGAYAVAAKIDAMQKPGEQLGSSPLVEARFA